MVTMLLTVLTAFITFVSLYFYICIRKIQKGRPKFPFPTPTGFFRGHTSEIRSTKDILIISGKYLKKYGPTVCLQFGPVLHGVMTTDLKLIEQILTSNKNLTKSLNYYFLVAWLGKGLLLSDGNRWKSHRKIITPAFHFSIFKNFISTFELAGNVLIDKLKKNPNKQNFEILQPIALCTLDIIIETSLGTRINAQQNETLSFVKSVSNMCRIVIERLLNPLKWTQYTYFLTRDYYIQKNALKILHTYSADIIQNRMNSPRVEAAGHKKSFLDLLLDNVDGKLTLKDIQEEVDTIMFGGHDTAAVGISYALYCLAENPEIQAKVLKEQIELFGEEKNPPITYQDLQNMHYLDLVIKESMRLFPPVPIIGRNITEEFTYGDTVITKGTNFAIMIYYVHRNPEFFPEPEKFIPERFLDTKNWNPYAYIPFSAGPRNCIGQKFSGLEMKSIISKIVRHFELSPAVPKHNFILAVEAVLNSKNGVKITLKSRT